MNLGYSRFHAISAGLEARLHGRQDDCRHSGKNLIASRFFSRIFHAPFCTFRVYIKGVFHQKLARKTEEKLIYVS
jgi:hypothetical protein